MNINVNQRATVGWKLTKTAEILVDPYMVRIESGSPYTTGEDAWETAIMANAQYTHNYAAPTGA